MQERTHKPGRPFGTALDLLGKSAHTADDKANRTLAHEQQTQEREPWTQGKSAARSNGHGTSNGLPGESLARLARSSSRRRHSVCQETLCRVYSITA